MIDCVARLPRRSRRTWLIVRAGPLDDCCVRALVSWRRRCGRFLQVVALEAVDLSTIASRRPASKAEPVVDSDHLMKILQARGYLSDARQAWVSPPEVAPGATPTHLAQAILELIRRPTAGPLTVGAAARALRLTPRRLHRLSLRLFGHPPRVLLALARVDAITRSLRHSSESLEQIAEENGFSDAGSMSRVFFRYVGIRPGAFRRGANAPLSDHAMTDGAMSDRALERRGKRA